MQIFIQKVSSGRLYLERHDFQNPIVLRRTVLNDNPYML